MRLFATTAVPHFSRKTQLKHRALCRRKQPVCVRIDPKSAQARRGDERGASGLDVGNLLLAEIACKDSGKDRLNVWHPDHTEAHLQTVMVKVAPGIGENVLACLDTARIGIMRRQHENQPDHLVPVAVERMCSMLDGFDVKAVPQACGRYGQCAEAMPRPYHSPTKSLQLDVLVLTHRNIG